MVRDKKSFCVSLILFFASIAMNIPFPNDHSYREKIVVFNIIINSEHGLRYVGIISLSLLILSLYFLWISLGKYKTRLIVVSIIIAIILPPFLVKSYQKTFATGIYAISYDRDKSNCRFNMKNEKTLHAEFELPFVNYGRTDVQFKVEFYDQFEEDVQMVSLLNKNGLNEVTLYDNERKIVKIKTNIDVSKNEDHIDGGEATDVNIIIRSGNKSRKL